jgi:hypothetical protein
MSEDDPWWENAANRWMGACNEQRERAEAAEARLALDKEAWTARAEIAEAALEAFALAVRNRTFLPFDDNDRRWINDRARALLESPHE